MSVTTTPAGTIYPTPKGWIGVDLDGTLAHYDGWKGIEHIGDPIMPMLLRVRKWLAEGREVGVFTARVCQPGAAGWYIEQWLMKYLGRGLPITNVKDYDMIELWDDRAVQVEENTGRQYGPSRIAP